MAATSASASRALGTPDSATTRRRGRGQKLATHGVSTSRSPSPTRIEDDLSQDPERYSEAFGAPAATMLSSPLHRFARASVFVAKLFTPSGHRCRCARGLT